MQHFSKRVSSGIVRWPLPLKEGRDRSRLLRVAAAMVACFLWSLGAYAQEVCNNGLDDDNDGYVDCFDPDCSGNFFCTNQFFGGPVPACQTTPPPAPPFTMNLLWRTDSVATPLGARFMPVVGDIDLDGVPEVIAGVGNQTNGTYVFNGANGVLERTVASPLTSTGLLAYAIADIDNDGFGEIVTVSSSSVGRQLLCYEHNGVLKWSSATPVGYGAADDTWTPAIADFEEDGTPEVYLGNQIFNGATGALIMGAGSAAPKGANGGSANEPFSVAADILPPAFCPDCAGLELVCGNTVYSVNLLSGTMVAQTSITGFPDGITTLADVDRDGDIDGVIIGQNVGARGILYAWDLQTSSQIGNTIQIDATSIAGGAITNVGGIPAIADTDNDGMMNIIVAGRNVVRNMEYNAGTFIEDWAISTVSLAGRSGAVLFDFEGDNNLECVLRDELNLMVLNAATGATRLSRSCVGNTRFEAPIVVDVDNNGQANLVCQCGPKIEAFAPSTVPWSATRSVFNQRQYFVLNIRDNLRVPRVQQEQQIGFPAGAPVNYPFNAFMKQTPRLADNGALVNPAADDLASVLNPFGDIDLGPCQNGIRDSVGIRLTLTNSGSATMPAGTLIAFYAGNPYAPGAIFLRTFATPLNIPAGASQTMPFVYVPDQGGTFDLYYQVNDAGTNPIPITGPAFGHQECNYGNNMGFVSIVNCGNLPPVIDTFGLATDTILITSPEDLVVQLCVSATDPQGDAYDVTALIGTPTLGTATGVADGDSCITLTPNLNVVGTTTFSVIICDNGNVSLCDTAVVVWTVYPINDPPIAVDDALVTNEDTPASVDVLLNDTDQEGDPLAAVIIAGPFNGTATLTIGMLNYTPAPNYFGLDSVIYRVCDNALPPGCDTGVVRITVNPVNDAPVGWADSLSMPNDTITVTIAVQANDSDLEAGVLTTTILCQPLHGTASVIGTDIVYNPDSTYLGADSLCYTICDNGTPVLCDTAWVYFDIFNGNEPPIALDDADSTTYMDPVSFNVFLNDTDPNGHVYTITFLGCGPANGTVVYDSLTGQVNYTPDTLFLGTETLCYVICDIPPAGPSLCDTAQITITVISDNQPPIAVDDTLTVPYATSGSRDVFPNDSDPDPLDSLTVTIIAQPANGTALLSGTVITYTPSPTFSGTDNVCYALCDNGFPSLCDTACLIVTVLPPNEVVVPNGFSPNGDGINDFLEINAIQGFPNNQFAVFNRWGGQVFEAQGYNNEWDGTYNGNPLPDGTYFWRLDPGDGSAVLTGNVLIYR